MEGLILVHHLELLAKKTGKHAVDPIKDLRPVCANCHLVIHRRAKPYSIAEVRKMIRQAKLLPGSDEND